MYVVNWNPQGNLPRGIAWRHDRKTTSHVTGPLCRESTGAFTSQRAGKIWSSNVLFFLRLNELLNKQASCRQYENHRMYGISYYCHYSFLSFFFFFFFFFTSVVDRPCFRHRPARPVLHSNLFSPQHLLIYMHTSGATFHQVLSLWPGARPTKEISIECQFRLKYIFS